MTTRKTSVTIAGRRIGSGCPALIIAEIGFNHEGDLDLAERMVQAAADSGACVAKFQTYRAAELVLESTEHFAVIRSGELDRAAHHRLAAGARERGILFLSTPYDERSVDLLQEVGVPAFKIASMDLTNTPLLEYVADTGKPIILSTGMATLEEIDEALEAIEGRGNENVILLHCVSKYPTAPADAHLRTIVQLQEVFGRPVGYSDHTLGTAAASAAIALGACVIEKHFTTDRSLSGPDHAISADPREMTRLVDDVRTIEAALGRAGATEARPDRPEAALYRRGLFARIDLTAGDEITADMISCVRPPHGLPPRCLAELVGRRAEVDIRREQPFEWDLVRNSDA